MVANSSLASQIFCLFGCILTYLLYRSLQQRVNYSDVNSTVTWSAVRQVPSDDVTAYYVISVVLTDPYGVFEYRVLTNWNDYGKVFPGLPSPSSAPVRPIAACIGRWSHT